MKRGVILFGVLALAILSLAFIAGVQAFEAGDIGCAGARSYSASYQAQFCDSSSGNYNPYYCQCVGGSSGNGGEEPTFTPEDAKEQLINKLNDAFGTNKEEQEYIFDDLTDSQKAGVERVFDEEMDFYENQALEKNMPELLEVVNDIKDMIGQEGTPPEVRAQELSIPIVGGKGTYGWEISTNGYPNLEWLSEIPEYPRLTLWHGEDGKVHYDVGDNKELIYSGTQNSIPFEGFGVHQGEEIAMPNMATYAGEPGITASANNIVWGEVSFNVDYNEETGWQTLHPTVKVDEGADVGMQNFDITIRDENGNVIDTISMTADIQPIGGGGLINYRDKSAKSFGSGIGYFFICIFILLIILTIIMIPFNRMKLKAILKDSKGKEKEEQLANFDKQRKWAVVAVAGMIICIMGIYLIIGGSIGTGIISLIIGLIIMAVGAGKSPAAPVKTSVEKNGKQVKK